MSIKHSKLQQGLTLMHNAFDSLHLTYKKNRNVTFGEVCACTIGSYVGRRAGIISVTTQQLYVV